jgi:hypothetical protein
LARKFTLWEEEISAAKVPKFAKQDVNRHASAKTLVETAQVR